MAEQQLMITREELADMYYAGSYWVDDGFGTAFDYVGFGIAVAETIAERLAEQETKAVGWGIFYKGVLQEFAYNEEAARAICDEDYVDILPEHLEVLPLTAGATA